MDNDVDVQKLRTIDPRLLLVETDSRSQPCTCGGYPSCESCYLLSPQASLSDDFSSPTFLPFGQSSRSPETASINCTQNNAGAELEFWVPQSQPQGAWQATAALHHPSLQELEHTQSRSSFTRPTTPTLHSHVGSVYTPGYNGSAVNLLPFEQIGTLPTPCSTAPSIFASDSVERTLRWPCRDFTGKNRSDVSIEYDVEYQYQAADLMDAINNRNYRIHSTNEVGINSALSALQKSLSFNLTGRVPATVGQLRIHLQNSRSTFTPPSNISDNVTPSELSSVLDLYGNQSGEQFQLGIVFPGSVKSSYRVSMERIVMNKSRGTIWLFYDVSGEDTGLVNHWSAITPVNPSRTISYAAALRSPHPRSAQPAVDNSRLSAIYASSNTKSLPVNSDETLLSPSRYRSRPASRASNNRSLGSGTTSAHRSARTSRAPSECGGYNCDNCGKSFQTPSELTHHRRKYNEGDRPHRCFICKKGFKYPKDLKRHKTTHSSLKSWGCDICPKSFTRKDNLKRHKDDEHTGAV